MRLQISSISVLVIASLTPCVTHAQQSSPAKHVAPSAGQNAAGSQQPAQPKDTLLLTASGNHAPVSTSLAEFRALPHVNITVHNAHANADETYSGVPLAVLLGATRL
jgi:hypothetical protein